MPVAPAGLDMPRWFSIIERDLLVRGVLGSRVPMPGPVVRRITGEVYRQLAFARPREASEDVVRAFTRHHSSAQARQGLPRRRAAAAARATLDAFELDRIDVPVLLVWGDRDRMVSHEGARHVLDAGPRRARTWSSTGCGHCPQLEAAGRVHATCCSAFEPLLDS